MKTGILYVVAGIVAVVGALAAAYILIVLGQAIGAISTANPADFPPGTDLALMQESARSLGTLILVSWVWIASVLLSGMFSIKAGIGKLRGKKGAGK